MKKFALILAAACVAVSFVSCDKTPAAANAAATTENKAYEPGINIRYVSQDSILKYYIFSDATNQASQKLQLELLTYGNQLQNQAQQLQNEFQQKLQANQFINQTAAEAAYKSVQQKIQNYDNLFNQRQAKVQEQLLAQAQALNDSITNFIKAFNQERQYDAILIRENCLYLNPALDITQEVIDGLNARYQVPVAEPAKK